MTGTRRLLTLAGLTLVTASAIAMSATAASAAPAQPNHPGPAASQTQDHGDRGRGNDHRSRGHDHRGHDDRGRGHDHRSRTWTVGVFKNEASCELAGRIGKRAGLWNSWDCDRIGRSRLHVLEVEKFRGHRGHR